MCALGSFENALLLSELARDGFFFLDCRSLLQVKEGGWLVGRNKGWLGREISIYLVIGILL